MAPHCSNEEKTRILLLYNISGNYRWVGNMVQRNPMTVRRWVERWEDEGHMRRRAGSGRPYCTEDEDEYRIHMAATNFPFANAATIRTVLGLDCSPATVRRVLEGVGLERYVAREKDALTDDHRQQRLHFAQLRAHWTAEQWAQV